mgnify:CR=1 FL=1
MSEVPDAREDHGQALLVSGTNHILVLHRTTRLYHRCGACLSRLKQAVRKDGREAITHYTVEARFGDDGWDIVSVNYRLTNPDDSNAFPAAVNDAKRVVRWVKANATATRSYLEDSGAVGLGGLSIASAPAGATITLTRR